MEKKFKNKLLKNCYSYTPREIKMQDKAYSDKKFLISG